MSENKRRGLGRGLGALIPTGTPATKPAGDRPVDVFFPDRGDDGSVATAVRTETDSDNKTTESTAPAEAKAAPAAPAGPAAPVSTPTPAPAAAPVQAPAAHSTVPTRGPSGLPTGGITEALTRTVSAPAQAPAAPAAPAPAIPVTTTAPAAQPAQPARPAPAAPAAGADEVELVPVPGARFEELPVDAIVANSKQPRTVFDEDAMAELVHSVREIGVLQPIVVRQISGQGADARYELIMGERRLRASRKAGLDRIPAIVRETGDDVMLRDALLENLHRSQLNPLEEAAAYQQLLDDFGCTHEDLATRIGRSRPQISNTIRLLRLPPAVQRRVAAGVLSAGHARALLGLDDHDSMDRLAQRIVAEGLSVRATEETVALNDGAGAAKPRKRPRPGTHHSELDDLAARLADRLDTRVSVALGRTKGKLGIEFASVEDLNRILDILAPGLRGAFRD